MPWRAGIGYIPTNDLNAGSSSAPSTISPPIGLGRSSTTNGMPLASPPPASTAPSSRRRSRCGRRPPAGRRRARRRPSASPASGRDPRPCRASRSARRSSRRSRRRSSRRPSTVAADAVLGREQRDQLQVLVARDQIDGRHAGAIDRAVVGDEPDPLAAEIGRQVREEHVDARAAPDQSPSGAAIVRTAGVCGASSATATIHEARRKGRTRYRERRDAAQERRSPGA